MTIEATTIRATTIRAATIRSLFALGLGLMVSAVGALSHSGPVRAEGLTIGVEAIDYFPHYRGVGEYAGFARALFDDFAADQNHQITYRALPVRRLYEEFHAGRVDFKYPDNRLWGGAEREGKSIRYSQPVAAFVDGVSVLPHTLGNGIDALKSIGIVLGFTAFEYAERLNSGRLRTQDVADFTALINLTLLGRTDGAYGNVAVIQYHLRETLRRPGALVFDPDLPHTRDFYHLSTIKHPAVIEQFDAWMAANRGRVAQMKARFGID